MHTRDEAQRTPVRPPDAPPPSGAYTPGMIAGPLLFLSGQAPVDADGTVVGPSITDQVTRALDNLEAVASSAGTSLRDAGVRVGVYLSNLQHFDEMDRAYAHWFGGRMLPARTTIQSDFPDFDVEIDAVVVVGDHA